MAEMRRDQSKTPGRARQVLFAVLLLSTAERVTPSLAADLIRTHLGLTSSQFGVLAGMSAFAFGLAQFPGGHLADTRGAMRLVRYAALSSAGFALVFVLAPNYPVALVGRAGFGLSDSLVFIGMLRLAADTGRGGSSEIGKIQAAVGIAFAGAAIAGLGLNRTTFPLVFGVLALALVKESFPQDRSGAVLGLANVGSSVGAAALGAAVGLVVDSRWQGVVSQGLRVYPVSAYRLVPAVLGAACALAVLGVGLARETHAEQPAAGW